VRAHNKISVESAGAHVIAFILAAERKWYLIWHDIHCRKLPLWKLWKKSTCQ